MNGARKAKGRCVEAEEADGRAGDDEEEVAEAGLANYSEGDSAGSEKRHGACRLQDNATTTRM